jgi:restriction endonuclease
MRVELAQALAFDDPRRFVVRVYKWRGGWDRHAGA